MAPLRAAGQRSTSRHRDSVESRASLTRLQRDDGGLERRAGRRRASTITDGDSEATAPPTLRVATEDVPFVYSFVVSMNNRTATAGASSSHRDDPRGLESPPESDRSRTGPHPSQFGQTSLPMTGTSTANIHANPSMRRTRTSSLRRVRRMGTHTFRVRGWNSGRLGTLTIAARWFLGILGQLPSVLCRLTSDAPKVPFAERETDGEVWYRRCSWCTAGV